MTAEDLGCRLDSKITGQTDPAARSANVPPDPIDRACGCAGNIGKNRGTKQVQPGAQVSATVAMKPEGTRALYLPNQSLIGGGGGEARKNEPTVKGLVKEADEEAACPTWSAMPRSRDRINPSLNGTTLRRGINRVGLYRDISSLHLLSMPGNCQQFGSIGG